MQTTFDRHLNAHLTLDDQEQVRQILHPRYFPSAKSSARTAAGDYLVRMADTFRIPTEQLRNLHLKTSFHEPREQGVEYRLHDVKKFFASATYCYCQTLHNVPVWRAGATVTVKENPYRVVRAAHHGHRDLHATLPPAPVVERVRRALAAVGDARRLSAAAGESGAVPDAVTLARVFGGPAPAAGEGPAPEAPAWMAEARITRARFYIYRYEAAQRQPGHGHSPHGRAPEAEAHDHGPTLPLPPVPETIRDGRHYLVAELVFHLPREPRLNWKALVEVETGTVLWLEAMTASVFAKVFTYDPATSTGDLGNTPDSTDAVLNPLRDDVELLDLDVAMMGEQSLSGAHVTIVDEDFPDVAPPTEPTGTDFIYDARTNDFAAVSAYYHTNNFFRVVEELGFDLADYFNGTAFPVHVDHRASHLTDDGIEINAFCHGDGVGDGGDGIGLVGFCLSDKTGTDDTTLHPLGRAVDKWVNWHELGGHGILWDHVDSWHFGKAKYPFVHSAGDAIAAFQNDPESQLRGLPQRFQYAPWINAPRRFDRSVADGWGWGGSNDTGDYESEQVLDTTLFRIYRSLGGDAAEVAKRWQASRVATWLVLNGVGKLSPGTNPETPEELYGMLFDADADDWTSEGWAGGAYHKVIRWSFEKQGLWSGEPPAVDLYIDDGRGGEYPYQAVHWHNPSVWNRTSDDAVEDEQPGVAGVQSYAYVKVKNRGTSSASGTVKLYHCKPGAGLTWPNDFEQVGPAEGLPTGSLLANSGNAPVVGPFAWTPNVNAYGHDCLLAIVSSDLDPSNVDNLEPGQTIPEWRLVPHDNNVGQRNVDLVPGGGGGEALAAGLDGVGFFVGNTFNRPATMEVRVEAPRVLAERGWKLQADDGRFTLRPGEKREVRLRLERGKEFAARDLREAGDRAFAVLVYGDGMLVGGMTYAVDPALSAPAGARLRDRCTLRLRRLLRRLRALFHGSR